MVARSNSDRGGQVTFPSSVITSRRKVRTLPPVALAPAALALLPAVDALFLLATDLPDDLAILHPNLSLKRTGRAGGTRTPNIRFWRPALFHWSYCPTPPSWSKIPALNKQLNPIRIVLFVLHSPVVAALAFFTRQRDLDPHVRSLSP